MPSNFYNKLDFDPNMTLNNFAKAVVNNNLEEIEKICKKPSKDFDIDQVLHFTYDIEHHETALQLAIFKKFNDAAELLIKICGADVNAQDEENANALFSAILALNEKGVDILLANGANPNTNTSVSLQPLYVLSELFPDSDTNTRIKIMSIAKKLINHGANDLIIDDTSFWEAYDSILNSNSQSLQSTEQPTIPDYTTLTPEETKKHLISTYQLKFAQTILNNNLKEVKKICKNPPKDFDINYVLPVNLERSEQGHTGLQIALINRHNPIAKELITGCGADVNAYGASRMPTLFSPTNSLNEEGVDILLAHNVNTNPNTSLPYQPLERLKLLFHAEFNQTTIMSITKKLIDHGANTSIINDDPGFMEAYYSYLNSSSPPILTTEQSTIPNLTTLSPEEAQKQLNNMTDYFLTTGHSSNLTTTTFASSTPQSNQTTPVIYDNRNNITIPGNNVTVVTNQVHHTRLNDPAEVTNLNILTQMMSAIQNNPWTTAAVGTLVAAGIAGLSWFGLKNRKGERQDNRLTVTYSKMSFDESLMLIKSDNSL